MLLFTPTLLRDFERYIYNECFNWYYTEQISKSKTKNINFSTLILSFNSFNFYV